MSLKELEEAIKNLVVLLNKEGYTESSVDALINLEDVFDAFKKQLRKLAKEITSKYNFESQHAQLDRKSGYIVSKPQQDFVNFLAWLDDKFEKVLEGDI